MSDATDAVIEDVRSLLDEEDLTDDEEDAAEGLVTLLTNANDLGSDEMKRMRPYLERIDQDKRSRHGLGWDM